MKNHRLRKWLGKRINKHDQLDNNIPDHFKTQDMCIEAVRIEPFLLACIPDHFKTQGMCNQAVCNMPCTLLFVPDHLRTQKMCNEIMHAMPKAFHRIPDCFKTQDKCKKAVEKDRRMLKYVSDHFETLSKKAAEIWYAETKNVLIKVDVQIWSKRGYNQRLLWAKTNNWYFYDRCKQVGDIW